MPPPSHLAIATSSVRRLLKEEASYHSELTQQQSQIAALEAKLQAGQDDEDGNGEFMVKQQKTALEQTKAVFGPLKQRIEEAVAKLEEQIAVREETGAKEEEMSQAKEVLAQAKASSNGSS